MNNLLFLCASELGFQGFRGNRSYLVVINAVGQSQLVLTFVCECDTPDKNSATCFRSETHPNFSKQSIEEVASEGKGRRTAPVEDVQKSEVVHCIVTVKTRHCIVILQSRHHWLRTSQLTCRCVSSHINAFSLDGGYVNVSLYTAQYPFLVTVQSALHFISLADLFNQIPSQLLWEEAINAQRLRI